jgi:hypothetical protein
MNVTGMTRIAATFVTGRCRGRNKRSKIQIGIVCWFPAVNVVTTIWAIDDPYALTRDQFDAALKRLPTSSSETAGAEAAVSGRPFLTRTASDTRCFPSLTRQRREPGNLDGEARVAQSAVRAGGHASVGAAAPNPRVRSPTIPGPR